MSLRRSPRLAAKGTGANYALQSERQTVPATKSQGDSWQSKGWSAASKNAKGCNHCLDRHAMQVKMIRNFLESGETVNGKENKVIVATGLFRFINDNAMDFVKIHSRFSNVVLVKALEMLVEARDYPNLIAQVTLFLERMGISSFQIDRFKQYNRTG
jgi:hypothetical protein